MVTLVNRAKVSTSTTGTGTITLGSAADGYQTFAAAGVTNGQTVRYVIEDGNSWEIGTGTYTATGTTLSRSVSESSNAGAAINLSGSAVVYVSAAAADIVATSGDAMTGDLDFGDNVKATFGADEDLWIYHDGGSSYIYDRGTGNLRIITNSTISIDGASGGEFMAQFVTNGAVSLYYDSSKKFDTTTTGISVTGNISVTGTVDGRDVATDGTKLDGIEAGADVTDTDNVTAAGALMDSEVTNLAAVKAFDPAAYATAAQGSLADTALQPADNISELTNDAGYTTNTGTVTSIDLIAGTGISVSGGPVTSSGSITVTNTAPDQTVALTAGTSITITGTYPNFTIDSTAMAATNPVITAGTITEDVYTISGTSAALEPDNGSVQLHTLSGNTTYTDGFSAGQAITLMIDDGTAYTVTWPTMTWVNNAGAAPTLATTGYTVVAIWKVSTTLYGALVGDGT